MSFVLFFSNEKLDQTAHSNSFCPQPGDTTEIYIFQKQVFPFVQTWSQIDFTAANHQGATVIRLIDSIKMIKSNVERFRPD